MHLSGAGYLDEKYINGTIYQRNDMSINHAVRHNSSGQVIIIIITSNLNAKKYQYPQEKLHVNANPVSQNTLGSPGVFSEYCF